MAQRDERGRDDRDILDIIPERFDADPDSRQARRGAHTRLILTVALTLLAVAALGVAARQLFMGDSSPKPPAGGVPTIAADDRPIKTKPADPGGLDVPNKDKLIYERIGQNEAKGAPERLLPPPEQPAAPPPAQPRVATIKPAFPAPPSPQPAPKPGSEATPEMLAEAARQSAPAHETPAAPPAPAAASAPQAHAPAPAAPVALTPPRPAPVQPAAPQAAAPRPAPAAPAQAASGGGWVVQLAALKTEADARNEWSKLAKANRDLLGAYASDIIRVDLGAKGVFWRLRAGPMDEAKARLTCAELSKRNQGCIVARK